MEQIEINSQFAKALQQMRESSKCLFVTGRAGTGKSTLLKYFVRTEKEKPVVLAPTGVAALNAGGQTIHRFFRFKIDVTPESVSNKKLYPEEKSLFRALKTVIVDEASMLRADLLDCIDILLKRCRGRKHTPFGGVRMIFFGDLYQIPPVVTSGERKIFQELYPSPYFFHSKAFDGMQWDIIELEKIYRQKDPVFIEILNRIRKGAATEEDILKLNERAIPDFKIPKTGFWITLTGTNRRADAVNARQLNSLSDTLQTSYAKTTGDFGREHCPAPLELSFKKKAQIMMLNNDPEGRWVNGSVGAVEKIISIKPGEESLLVRLQGENAPATVQRCQWELIRFGLEEGKIVSQTVGKFSQLPFRLAWAVTIHKSQGKTCPQMVFDCDRFFGFGQAYVALSRCSSLQGLVLRRPLSLRDIRTDFRIQKFFTERQYSKQAWTEEDKVHIIQKAISKGLDLKIVYLKANDIKTERTVAPLQTGTEDYQGHSFFAMRAFCRLRKSERVFRMDRILNLELLPLLSAADRTRPG